MGRMNRISRKSAYCLALCLGLVSAGFVACGGEKSRGEASDSNAPAAFVEQKMLANAADSLGDFAGTVILPESKDVALHGKEVIGGLPAIMQFLEERKTGLNFIYKKYQSVKPGFEGNLALDITVDPCGDVSALTEISSTTGVAEFNREIMSSFGKQKFPKTDQGHYTVSFTLTFVKDAAAK